MRVIQLGLIDAGSYTRSLSVLLSAVEIVPAVEMSLRTQTAVEIAQKVSVATICTRVRVSHVPATATI